MISETKTLKAIVTDEMTALAVKSGDAKVLATPMMAALMEQTALELTAQFLEEGKTTVGTALAITHLSATPVGMEITATATITKVEGKLLEYTLTASDAVGLIGEGTHTRAIVDRAKFQQRADSKGK